MSTCDNFYEQLSQQLQDAVTQGIYFPERVITTPQGPEVTLADGSRVLNFCANNYLGLGNHPEVIAAAKKGLDRHGFGMASVALICGTHQVHKVLEKKISDFLQTEDTIVYGSCFNANTGLFESILSAEDAIISDSMNHASIIDGVRLCKAKRYRYASNNMQELEKCLQQAEQDGVRYKMIATDGVFSMDGVIADLPAIYDLADKYQALVMVDDCHATGIVGENGRGSHEYCGVMDRVDIITSTFGKAMGGALGGFTSGRKILVDWLRQHSRSHNFTNSIPPTIAEASIQIIDMLSVENDLQQQLYENAGYFKQQMETAGFTLASQDHPIVAVLLGDDKLTAQMTGRLMQEGIFVVGFWYPVVPKGVARIRTQMCAAHTRQHLDKAISAFTKVGKELGVIK